MKRSVKMVLGIYGVLVLAWSVLSAYFMLCGRDSQGDSFCKYPSGIDYREKTRCALTNENGYTYIKALEETMLTNNASRYLDYLLLQAYINGTTNRLRLASSAKELIVAESNTFKCASYILNSPMFYMPRGDTVPVSLLMRIANMSRVKAVYEASQGDVAKGRKTLMNVVETGRKVMGNESFSVRTSQLVGFRMAIMALDIASQPLFVDGDEAWLADLQSRYREFIEDDTARAKLAAGRAIMECWQCMDEMYSANRLMVMAHVIGVNSTSLRNTFDAGLIGVGDIPAQRWDGLERGFVAAFLTVFPGYARYAMQPNRSIDVHKTKYACFCRKLEEPYDIDYAQKGKFCWESMPFRDFNPFKRNWLGESMMGTECYSSDYLRLFRNRFNICARIVKIACLSYKMRHGAFPVKLEVLVPEFLAEVPHDPYDGKPMHYNSEKLFLWTPGEDLSFDGNVKFLPSGKVSRAFLKSRYVYFIESKWHDY